MNSLLMRQVAFLSKMAAVTATVLAVSAGTARADSLQATDDAYIALGSGTNFGGGPNLSIQNISGENRALLRFSFSTQPGTALIEKASLRLWVETVGQTGVVDLYAVLDPWIERTVVGDLAPGADAVPFASKRITLSDVGNFVTIDITDQARAWHESGVANNGIFLVANAGGVDVTFNSKENPQTAHQPELEVVTIAAPTTLVPAGAVVAFDLPSCPAGWNAYTPALGRYLVAGSAPGVLVGAALANGENRMAGGHSHNVAPPVRYTTSVGDHAHGYNDLLMTVKTEKTAAIYDGSAWAAAGTVLRTAPISDDDFWSAGVHTHELDIPAFRSSSVGSGSGTNAPYVTLLVCQKN